MKKEKKIDFKWYFISIVCLTHKILKDSIFFEFVLSICQIKYRKAETTGFKVTAIKLNDSTKPERQYSRQISNAMRIPNAYKIPRKREKKREENIQVKM